MANSISARNAKNEYEKFVAAHKNPKVVYGSHAGWGFPTSIFSPTRAGCQLAGPIINSLTVVPEVVCNNPADIIDGIFDSVLGLIPEKPRKKYTPLILSFKKIGQLKLNRLKKDITFQQVCNVLLDPSSPKKQKADAEKKLASLVKDTMKSIISHIPACTFQKEFVEFIFEETELALNNAAAARANQGTGTLVAQSLVTEDPMNRGPSITSVPQTLAQDPASLSETSLAESEAAPAPASAPSNTGRRGTLVAENLALPAPAPPAANNRQNGRQALPPLGLARPNNGGPGLRPTLSGSTNTSFNSSGYVTASPIESEYENENSNNNLSVKSFKPLEIKIKGGKKSRKTRKQRKHTKKHKKTRAHKRR